MAYFDDTVLQAIPHPALIAEAGRVCCYNAAAGQLFENLAQNAAIPDPLPDRTDGAGLVYAGGQSWQLTTAPLGERTLFLLHPVRSDGLSPSLLEGTLRRLHEQIGQLMLSVQMLGLNSGEDADPKTRQGMGQINRTLCQMLRLTSHMDLLRDTENGSYLFQPVTLDLAGLCSQVCTAAGDLLQLARVNLTYTSPLASLLVSGDSALLQKLLVELLSNAARAAGPDSSITLSLAKRDNRAILTLSGPDVSGSTRTLSSILSGDRPEGQIPLPGEGAGLGILLIQRVVSLHQGTLMMERQNGINTILSLPLAPHSAPLPMRTPTVQYVAGFCPELISLSDLLPSDAFLLDDLS